MGDLFKGHVTFLHIHVDQSKFTIACYTCDLKASNPTVYSTCMLGIADPEGNMIKGDKLPRALG